MGETSSETKAASIEGAPAPQQAPDATTPAEPSVEERVAKAVEKAVADATVKLQRQFQSESDRAIAKFKRETAVERVARQTAEQKLTELDPDAAKDVELARLRAQVEGTPEDQEAVRTQELLKEFLEPHLDECKEIGIEPTDKRIDWAVDAPTLFQRNKRILASFRAIKKEEAAKSREKGKAEAEEERRKAENNSVDTSATPATGGLGIPTDMTAFRKWWPTLTPEQRVKLGPKVDEMRTKNLIR